MPAVSNKFPFVWCFFLALCICMSTARVAQHERAKTNHLVMGLQNSNDAKHHGLSPDGRGPAPTQEEKRVYARASNQSPWYLLPCGDSHVLSREVLPPALAGRSPPLESAIHCQNSLSAPRPHSYLEPGQGSDDFMHLAYDPCYLQSEASHRYSERAG
jgi:hypothetical protein